MTKRKGIRRITYWLLMLLIVVLLLEVILRVFLSFSVGSDILLYGFVKSKQEVFMGNTGKHKTTIPTSQQNGYRKYFPYQKRKDRDRFGNWFDVQINGRGFRGADFDTNKMDSSLRIVCLGASSTFGYTNRDNETYPYYLDSLLTQQIDDFPFLDVEVLNMGIPKSLIEENYELFLKEVIPLQADIITFYEGMNNTGYFSTILNDKFLDFFGKYSILVRFGQYVYKTRFYSFDEDEVSEQIEGKAAHFVGFLNKINQKCIEEEIHFYVISQTAKSLSIDTSEINAFSYDAEVDFLENKLESAPLNRKEVAFLVHDVMMDSLENWAAFNNVPYIDGIEALDANRKELYNVVHLNPAGNMILAKKISRQILKDFKTPNN